MFLAATAKPRWDPHRKKYWDGKVGIWPFAKQEPAKKNSKNRPAGTLEWKSYTVGKVEYKEFMIDKVLPAIKKTWPLEPWIGRSLSNKTMHLHTLPWTMRSGCPLWKTVDSMWSWSTSHQTRPTLTLMTLLSLSLFSISSISLVQNQLRPLSLTL